MRLRVESKMNIWYTCMDTLTITQSIKDFKQPSRGHFRAHSSETFFEYISVCIPSGITTGNGSKIIEPPLS